MDHSNHVRLEASEISEATLNGATVYGPNDEKVGTISTVNGAGDSATVIVDVGGFLGLGSKPTELRVADLDVMRDTDGTVHATTTWTKDDLKDMPEASPRNIP